MSNDLKIPDGYQEVMAYLILERAGDFIEFAGKVLGATLRMKEMRDPSTIRHSEIQIGKSVIMVADATGDYKPMPGSFFVYVADADLAAGEALLLGATEVSPVTDHPYGRSGGVKDPFGNTWWVTSVK